MLIKWKKNKGDWGFLCKCICVYIYTHENKDEIEAYGVRVPELSSSGRNLEVTKFCKGCVQCLEMMKCLPLYLVVA